METLRYRETHAAVRDPHPLVEVAQIDREIATLVERRTLILQLHSAAKALLSHGYTRRQVRQMAGFDLPIGPSGEGV